MESADISTLVIVGTIIVGVVSAAFYFGGKKGEKSFASNETSAHYSNASNVKNDKKAKKKDKKPKNKAAKKQQLSSVIKSEIAAYEENDEDDDDDGRDDMTSPPPLEPVTPKPISSVVTSKPQHAVTVATKVPEAQNAKPVAVVVPAPTVAEATAAAEDDKKDKPKKAKETPEQKAARLERQKQAKVVAVNLPSSNAPMNTLPPPAAPLSSVPAAYEQYAPLSNQQVDGWAKVETRKPKPVTAPAPVGATKLAEAIAAETAPSASRESVSLTVDSKKVGIVVGPKGEALKKLQELLSVEIQTPDRSSSDSAVSVITVTGPSEKLAQAKHEIQSLCDKGFSPLLEGPDFMEGHITVPSIYVKLIIGTQGVVRKAIQDHTGVSKISVPPAPNSKDHSGPVKTLPVKVELAGHRAKVAEAKRLIKELMQYYHTPETHPGVVHNEMDVPSALYNIIIGKGGSEIKHIQNNFKVSVHIPNAESVNQNVVVVGELKNVTQACNYIQKIIDKATEDKEAAVIAADSWAEHETEKGAEANEEEWMKQYLKKPSSSDPAGDDADFTGGSSGQGISSNSSGDENPTLSMAYKGQQQSSSSAPRAFTPTTTGQSWAATVLQSSDGW